MITLTEQVPLETCVYRSRVDGAIVVEVETEAGLGRLRITLNDGTVWDGDPEQTRSDRGVLMDIEAARAITHQVGVGKSQAQQDADFRVRVEDLLRQARVGEWER
jgi:hypothetical protein